MASEAELWATQRATVEAALDFTISFLGCRMGSKNDKPLDATARSRLLDICRAVSIVESRHGTTGRSQPKRDPLQCGNPADSWWRELTGQAGRGSRFIREPGYASNYWANELADAASNAPGFNSAAKLELLADIPRGHADSGFSPAHSYTWGILYLVHRINTAVSGGRSFACGDLNRERLITGAASYNAGGVPDYEDRLRAALSEFGGLKTLDDDKVEGAAGWVEEDALLLFKQPPDPEPSLGISKTLAIFAIVAGIIAVPLIGWQSYVAVDYAADFATIAPRLLTNLTVLALVMERALAVLNIAWLGEETELRRARYALARTLYASAPDKSRAIYELSVSSALLAETEAKRARLRVVVGFVFGLAISGAGVRTLAALTTPISGTFPAGQIALFHSVDIILTAALLAGGSAGIAKLAELVRDAIESTAQRLRDRARIRRS